MVFFFCPASLLLDEVVITVTRTLSSAGQSIVNFGSKAISTAASGALGTLSLVLMPLEAGRGSERPFVPPPAVDSSEPNNPAVVNANEEKTADELLPGSLKRSPSYNPKYGQKTRKELQDLARKGDQAAKKMKKLIDDAPRLLDKNRNK